jgi:hypothetical protein
MPEAFDFNAITCIAVSQFQRLYYLLYVTESYPFMEVVTYRLEQSFYS